MRRIALFAALATLAGCGPTYSTSLIMDADVQIEAARSADAPRIAPYEYTLAESYLHKAREEQGYADYDVCIRFAKKALENAKLAKEKAIQQVKEQGVAPSAGPAGTVP